MIMINPLHNLIPAPQSDEIESYKPLVADWNVNGIQVIPYHNDTKPLSFLYLEKILHADKTIKYTRLLAILIIITISFILYSMTGRKEAFLYFIIPWFLNSMWLTVEIIEVLFVVLSLKYANRNGIFIGLAAVFRPYAVLYAALIENKQRLYVLLAGLFFTIILIYHNLFIPYGLHLLEYATIQHGFDEIDYAAIMVWFMFLIACWGNKDMIKYSIIASIPLLVKLYAHYFVPSFSFFFISYLMMLKSQDMETKKVH